jgi:hypothetical protein
MPAPTKHFVALKDFTFNGENFKKGETYEAKPADLGALKQWVLDRVVRDAEMTSEVNLVDQKTFEEQHR